MTIAIPAKLSFCTMDGDLHQLTKA